LTDEGGPLGIEGFDDDHRMSLREAVVASSNVRAWPLRYYFGVLAILLLASLPVLADLGIGIDLVALNQFIGLLFLIMWAMSWDFVSGYTDQISLGHGAFFAVGAYSSALLNLEFGLHPVLTIFVGTLLAAVAGLIIGVPALRLEGAYLSLVTLVAPIFVFRMLQYRSDVLGGIPGMAAPDNLLPVQEFRMSVISYYYLSLALLVTIFMVFFIITRSNTGEVFTAIGESERTVSSLGLNPAKFKVFAFVLSAAMGGFAAAVYVHTPNANPQPGVFLGGNATLGLQISLEVLLIAILGGTATIMGALVGGFAFVFLRAAVGGIDVIVPGLGVTVSELGTAVTFGLVGLLLWLRPRGILPTGVDAGRWILDVLSGRLRGR